MNTAATALDALILLWLVGTWFYEGHHRKCEVHSVCSKCGDHSDVSCTASKKD